MKPRRLIQVALECVVGVAVILVFAHRFIPARPEVVSAEVRNFGLIGLDGKPIHSSDLAGKAIVLNFWAPWCPPCKMEIPWLQSLQDADRGKLVVIGVVADPKEYDHAAAFMKAKDVNYLLVQDSDALESAFGSVGSLPTTFYITPTHHVVHTVSGLAPEYMMKRYAHDAITH
jgi:thiol-disulfide isomerase/thioredoxin